MQTTVISIPQGVKGLIFDLDGTLIDSMRMYHGSYNHALKSWGVNYEWQLFYSRAGLPIVETLELIADENNIVDANIDLAIENMHEYISENTHQMSLIEPTFEIVKSHFGKLPMAIGTGNNRYHVEQVLKQFELDRYIQYIVTASDVSNGKPHPETFLKCAELIEIEPQDCLVFEDGGLGIQAANRAGMSVVDVREHL